MRIASGVWLVLSVGAMFGLVLPAAAQPLPRPEPHAGRIVAAKGGEQLQFAAESIWRPVAIRQDLRGGDSLRTNASGSLSILFRDQTQIRVGRNSVLVVKDLRGAGQARFGLPVGRIWARAARGGRNLVVETPSAAAAIRGTDWSLAVAPDGRTALIVLEGAVELSNPQGSVMVRAGEAAVAAIGERPTKVVLVQRSDREQMLFYLSLRDAFSWLPASPLDSRSMRAARRRLGAIPQAARSAEDWLTLAEVGLGLDGRAFAIDALGHARAMSLDPEQQARADLVAGLIAGAEARWTDARGLLDRATPRLDGRRRVSARYGGYFAAALAKPSRAPELPAAAEQDDPYAALAQAWIAGFVQDPDAALRLLRRAERQFPDAVILPAARAQIAQLADRRDEMAEASARAIALDPDSHFALEARAYHRAAGLGDLDGALADLRRAARIAPGEADIWNAIGLVQMGRDAYREAEQALRRAIAADPRDPVARTNYAILLLDQSRTGEAKHQIDAAFALDSAFHAAYGALGRYYLQTGHDERAIEALLAGSAANPAHSNTLLGLAVSYYQNGQDALADQQLENANRLDPSDPIVSLARSAFAQDRYEADVAIASAREAIRRARARGGYFAPLAQSRQSGSYLANAFRFLNLEEWGRFYGDAVFDPFVATGYFDQAIAARSAPFHDRALIDTSSVAPEPRGGAFSSLIQGLLFDPLALASPLRRTAVMRQPFVDGEIGGGVILRDGEPGWTASAAIQGFSNGPVPMAISTSLNGFSSNGDLRNDIARERAGTVLFGANPGPYDHALLFANASADDPMLPGPDFLPTDRDDRRIRTVLGGVGWGHEFGARNTLMGFGAVIHGRDRRYRSLLNGLLTRRQKAEQTTGIVGVGHLVGLGAATLRYGLEGSRTRARNSDEVLIIFPPAVRGTNDPSISALHPYADVLLPLGDRVQIEAGVHGAWLRGAGYRVGRAEPLAGIAYAPASNHWLRLGYRQQTVLPSILTLSPVTTLGLVPNEAPVATGGRAETLMARWDAEWMARLFTAVEYQHQILRGVSVPIPQTIDSFDLTRGRLNRLTASADLWLGFGFGLFGLVALASSEDRSGTPNRGGDLPFVPRRAAQAGVTWAHPSRVKITLAEAFVGRRAGDLAGARLDSYATTDLSMIWEPMDRRLAVDLALLNLFDRSYRLAPGIAGPGRTFVGTLRVRF